MDRNKLIQKRNEYKHRVEQLDRYMNGTKQHQTSLYINEDSPYQQRRDSCDSDIFRTEQDEYNDKAKVKYEKSFFTLLSKAFLLVLFRSRRIKRNKRQH